MARTFATGFLHFGDYPGGEDGQSYSAHIWAKPSGNNGGYLFGKYDGGNGFFLRRDQIDATKYLTGHNGLVGGLSATGQVSLGVWQAIASTYDSSTSTLTLYKNGSSLVSVSQADIAANAASLGLGNRDDLIRDYTGDLAEFGYWLGHILTAAQLTLLAAGYSPLFIRPLPTIYRALIRDESGGLAIGPAATTTGTTPTVAVHPRIIYPASSIARFAPSRAAAGGIATGALVFTGLTPQRTEDLRLMPTTA